MRKWKIYSFNMCPALFYKLPILFSRVKLKAKHNFSQFIHRSKIFKIQKSKFKKILKIGIFECWSQVALSKFSQFKKILKIGIFESCSTLGTAEHLGRNISKKIYPVTVKVFKWIFSRFSISQYFLRQWLRGLFTSSKQLLSKFRG